MPIIRVDMFGRSESTKRKLVKELTMACVNATGCRASEVTVILTDIPKNNWGEGGELMGEPASEERGRN